MKFHFTSVSTPLAVCVSLLLGACSGDDDEQPPSASVPSPAEGVWSAPAYGKIFEFKRSANSYTSTMFHVTDSSCLRGKVENDLTADNLAQIARLTDNDEQIEISRPGAILAPGVDYIKLTPGVVYTRLTRLPDLCTDTQRVAVKGEPDYQFDPQRDFRIFWDTFNELYIDFSLSGTDWQQV